MNAFFTDLLRFPFLQYSVLAAFFTSICCGIIGSYTVVRKTTYVAGAIAHCVLGGMGAARYLQVVYGVTWISPLTGAVFAAVIAALIISAVTHFGKEREDTVLSAIWAIGMATGISFITATPGYYEDLMSYLFGNILMITQSDIWYIAILDVIIAGLTFLFYNKFLITSFQPETARIRGINTAFYHTLLNLLTSLSVVILTQVVGLVMVIALLTLPAATASKLSTRLWRMMLLSFIFCLLITWSGILISYGPELPTGATVIELAGVFYLAIIIIKYICQRIRNRKS